MNDDTPAPALLLGPLLRHVSSTSATIWVQTRDVAQVRVRGGGREGVAATFSVFGFHYALVVLEGLEPGQVYEYEVLIDDDLVWPQANSVFPPSRIATIEPSESSRIAFGSCRTSDAHDEAGNAEHGVDALRAYAQLMLTNDSSGWPDILVFLGDQVYADEELSDTMLEFIRDRRKGEEPEDEIRDYVEYDRLYQEAWGDPTVRWLVSTVPSAMIFDDHDVRDDWNTSWSWRQEIEQVPWWPARITNALASYWVYQHIGNLAPDELAEDPMWQLLQSLQGERDITETLCTFARRADLHPETYRWSYTRELGDARLVVVDSRAARKLDPDHRSMLDDDEMAWLDEHLRGDVRHLFIGTSLPFMLPPGLHDFEAMNEAMAQGAYGKVLGAAAEKVRRVIDLEHWGAFNGGFEKVFGMVMDVAQGHRGNAPQMIVFLSGDVHNSYLAEVTARSRLRAAARSHIVQAVCSPMRNPMPRALRVFMALFARGMVRPMRAIVGRTEKVPDPTYRWAVTKGPWFDNNLAICEVEGDRLRFRWFTGDVDPAKTKGPVRIVSDVVVG